MEYRSYLSLERLPGVHRDRHGNLELLVGDTMRRRVEDILKLDHAWLRGTVLSELLDWLRWGGENGVMWECTLPELIQIIEKWLWGNLGGTQDRQFAPDITGGVDWDKLWIERGRKDGVFTKKRCRCGTLFAISVLECHSCWQRWYDMETVNFGPRGEGTYNLSLSGASGVSVAAAVWQNRNWLLTVPQEFEASDSHRLPA